MRKCPLLLKRKLTLWQQRDQVLQPRRPEGNNVVLLQVEQLLFFHHVFVQPLAGFVRRAALERIVHFNVRDNHVRVAVQQIARFLQRLLISLLVHVDHLLHKLRRGLLVVVQIDAVSVCGKALNGQIHQAGCVLYRFDKGRVFRAVAQGLQAKPIFLRIVHGDVA